MDEEIKEMTMFAIEQPSAGTRDLYRVIFDTMDAMDEAMQSAQLSYAPGLLEAIHADEPPDISFFERLHEHPSPRTIWAIYAIVLDNRDDTQSLYIGSATAFIGGMGARFKTYDDVLRLSQKAEAENDQQSGVPSRMKEAVLDGSIITHKVPLV
ncbi:hypothetical protein LTR84_011237 [Exophiala bonariae]|uniref:Uncharacterized protein n=1 Tax=Exophiala bonariae TaxID=1690606 RepID=A0AAV9NIS2_9EURO|nr:hypothetical protein LTR84_011237 [Exophiala bonariae]